MKLRLVLSILFLTPLIGLLGTGCASKNPDDFERDDYFGTKNSMHSHRHFVPRQVQRN